MKRNKTIETLIIAGGTWLLYSIYGFLTAVIILLMLILVQQVHKD